MFKSFILLILISLALSANDYTTECKEDLKNITNSYHFAKKSNNNKEYKHSIKYFQQTTAASYSALESCKNHPLFDFNPIYSYIIASEFEIQKMENNLNYINSMSREVLF